MSINKLSLYHYFSCPYCSRTRMAVDKLHLDVELRDIHLNSKHWLDLMNNGGKTQVPCLLIEQTGESDLWLYESDDIISFLQEYADCLKQTA